MTNPEMRQALIYEQPIEHNGIQYQKITGIIYRKQGNGIRVQLELLDKSQNCVIYADAENVKLLHR